MYSVRNHLTIGEVSKLLNISAYNIRYYEKEGLISPSHVSESGYRLYDYEDLYALSAVMLLRDSNIPIKKIKQLFENYSRQGYIRLLEQSQERVKKQIEMLYDLKEHLAESLEIAKKTDTDGTFDYKDYPLRRLKILKRSNYNTDYCIKEVYDLFQKHDID